MTRFLFWNINQKRRTKLLPDTETELQKAQLIAELVYSQNIDVLMLAECGIPQATLLDQLNNYVKKHGLNNNPILYEYAASQLKKCEKIEVFTRFSSDCLTTVHESNRLTIRRLQLSASNEPILLAIAHLPDKQSYSAQSSQTTSAYEESNEIRHAERLEEHERTVLVGDLNMNPFDAGIINATGFHGVMTKKKAKGKRRTVSGRQYSFFYNPMWNLFGDFKNNIPGTYYHRQCSEPECLFWNMLDQVLIRPDLIDRFEDEELQIVSGFNKTSLISSKSGLPDKNISDHLPIIFSINL